MASEPHLLDALLDPARYQFHTMALWHFGAAALSFLCGALVLYWERGSKVSRLFAASTLMFTLWGIGRGTARLLSDPDVLQGVAHWIYMLVMLSLPLLYQFGVMMLRTDVRHAIAIRANWAIGIA